MTHVIPATPHFGIIDLVLELAPCGPRRPSEGGTLAGWLLGPTARLQVEAPPHTRAPMEASAIVLDFPERPTFDSLRANVKALYDAMSARDAAAVTAVDLMSFVTQLEGLTEVGKALVGEKVGEQAAGAAVAQGVALAAVHAGVVTVGRHVTSEYTDRMKRWAHHKGALPKQIALQHCMAAAIAMCPPLVSV